MNPKLKKLLERHEGKRNELYKDSVGYETIGIGHNVDANGLPDDIQAYLDEYGNITDKMIDRLLEEDIKNAIEDCEDIYSNFDNFSEVRQAALIDFLFNIGRKTALTFKQTNKAINNEEWEQAANLMRQSKWYIQVKNRGKEITKMIEEDVWV